MGRSDRIEADIESFSSLANLWSLVVYMSCVIRCLQTAVINCLNSSTRSPPRTARRSRKFGRSRWCCLFFVPWVDLSLCHLVNLYRRLVYWLLPAVVMHSVTSLCLSVVFGLQLRVPTPPGKSWIFWVKFPGPGKSWKMDLAPESPGNFSGRSWKVLEFFARLWRGRQTQWCRCECRCRNMCVRTTVTSFPTIC